MEIEEQNVIVSQGANVTLRCSALGGFPSPFITWLKDLSPLEPDYRYVVTSTNGQGSLVISDVTGSDAGQYSCVVRSNMASEIIQPDTRLIVGAENSGTILITTKYCVVYKNIYSLLYVHSCILHMHTHTHTHTNTCTHTYTHMHMHTHIHTHNAHTHTNKQHTHTYPHTHVPTHTHTHTYTYTHTHAYTITSFSCSLHRCDLL